MHIQDYVRIHGRKLDEMLNLFGEMVIGFSRIREVLLKENPETEKLEMSENFSRILREFQEKILSIRMVPLTPLFRQFYRFVREGAKDLGKEAVLEMEGEDTELDKNIIDQIGEPLKHLVRNCLDHGIESPLDREALGKPRKGRIFLKASYREGNIFLTVGDDGRGLDNEKIGREVVRRGLAEEAEVRAMPREKLYSFIFHPGFSTKKEVSKYSGRGVGMDVVKKNIENIRGNIEIESWPGRGTTFKIQLPLTLSILEVVIFRIGTETLAIPVFYVREILKMKEPVLSRFESRLDLLKLRGTFYPLFWADDFFPQVRYQNKRIEENYILFLEVEEKKFFLVAEEILVEEQVVLKRIPHLEKYQSGILGSSVLGNGQILFILDMFMLFQRISRETEGISEEERGVYEAAENVEYS